jgi:hypothetical protein
MLCTITLVAGCKEDTPSAPNPIPPPPPSSTPVGTSISVVAGNQQVGRRGASLPVAPVLLVKDQAGRPVRGATVKFAITGGGGKIDSASATTDSAGTVTVKGWTLGPTPGENTLSANTGSPGNGTTTVIATGRNPGWTILVYMAADNNLARFGVEDLDEMELAPTDPEVQVVVQAEFSPVDLQYSPCPSCQAPSTFRYRVQGTGNTQIGPDGPVEVIGNRDMTAAASLREFLAWGREQYPAEHYALVLWNHGGGYKGLIEDKTSAGSAWMPLSTLREGLTGAPPLDVIDFDMCLMGSADVLELIRGTAHVVVFSQDVEPGTGNPYAEIIRAVQVDPSASAQVVAARWVEAFYHSYEGNRSQTTKSAFDMSQYEDFSAAWRAVGTSLANTISANRILVGMASQKSQKFALPQLKDVVNWSDSMAVRTADPALRAQLAALKAAATAPGFRIAMRNRNGTDPSSPWVRRANGLSVLLPSGAAFDAMPSDGPASFQAYQQLLPDHPWTRMLAAHLVGAPVKGYRDLSPHRYETYLVWDTAAVRRGVDVDLWVLEPDGNLYVPWLGVISPNGTMSGDSHDNDGYFEGYAMNRFVQAGRYKFYAHLYSDTNKVGTRVDLVYRTNPLLPFRSLYSPAYPGVSKAKPMPHDVPATFSRIEAGEYSDVRYLAYWDVAPSGSPLSASPSLAVGAEASMKSEGEITSEQVDAVLRNLNRQVSKVSKVSRVPDIQLGPPRPLETLRR